MTDNRLMQLTDARSAAVSAAGVHIGRQPIYTPSTDVFGYELLFRHQGGASTAVSNGADATSRVISSAFTQFGLQKLVGQRHCFLNLTREFVVGELPLPFEPDRVVLEVLETIEVDDEVVDGVRALVERGFSIALDDMVLGGQHERLVALADFVKLDFSTTPDELRGPAVRRFHAAGIQVVAERLEDDADVARALELGFDLLQGYALARPQTLSVDSLSTGDLRRLELLAALNDENADLPQAVSLISTDPGLVIRVLQATNSAHLGLRRTVTSIREAVMILGMSRIRDWVSLMVAADVLHTNDEHLASIVTRARMCQSVATRLGASGEAGFTVGLLSGVASTLTEPVSELVSRLPLSPAVTEALVERGGALGAALDSVLGYEERSRLDRDSPGAVDADLGLAEAHLAALSWTTQTLAESGA